MGSCSFPKMLVTCFSTARSLMNSVVAMVALVRPAAISASTSTSRSVSEDNGERSAPDLRLVHLSGSPALLARRMRQRAGHYMPASLLDSKAMRLQRLYPRSVVKEAAGFILVPRPLSATI